MQHLGHTSNEVVLGSSYLVLDGIPHGGNQIGTEVAAGAH